MQNHPPEEPSATLTEAARTLCEALLGAGACCAGGAIHVCATAHTPDARRHVLATGANAPRSEHDALMLGLCRSRADAVLTTAANLRAEPELRHALVGPHGPALAALRRDELGKREPLLCAILTRSGQLPREHPVWSDGTRKVVFTEPEHVDLLRQHLGERAQIEGIPGLDARKALAWLRGAGAPDVSVEVGPTTATQLYGPPAVIDELWISRCDAPNLPPQALAGALPEAAHLFAGLTCVHESVRDEPSGRWVFQRWSRVARETPF